MTRSEFLLELQSRGIPVQRQHVDHAIATGRLTSRIVAGWRVYGARQVAQMEAYWRTARRGRPRKSRHQGVASCSS